MTSEMNDKVEISVGYTLRDANDEEIRIIETTNCANTARNFYRELTIKKDKALILTWLNALNTSELVDVYNLVISVIKERDIL